jgi:sterol desaturase/sphingolipid hydroxylase (fatty acid hydroxylase superfamily)
VPALAILILLLFLLESRFQLRKRIAPRWKRVIINMVVSLPSFSLLRFVFIPAMVWLAFANQSLRFGINYWFHPYGSIKMVIAFLMLDYGNYVWHLMNHKFSFLWRFHLVHHTDLDLDVSTAFRFHFGELIGSVLFRGAITMLSGASPIAVLVYEILFEAATQFHHSNLRLPAKTEHLLNLFFVTPRMHGIHHSVVKNETDSNYSVIFSFWDRFHRTICLNVPQTEIVIGVPSYNSSKELSSWYLLKLPFTKIRAWKAGSDEAEQDKEPGT